MTPMKRGLLLENASTTVSATTSPKDDPDEKGIVTVDLLIVFAPLAAVRKMTPMKRGLLLLDPPVASVVTAGPKDDPDEKGIVTLHELETVALHQKGSER